MVITCDDLIFNDFRMSDFDLVCSNGSDGLIDDTEDMGLTPTITKVFTGESPRSKFISQKYDNNPQITVKLMKMSCGSIFDDNYFTENDLRMLNRLLTGKPGYSWLKIISEQSNETEYYYRAKVIAIEYERLGRQIVGYNITFETDGGQAYSEEQTVKYTVNANTYFYLYCNSDDLHNYTLPVIKITPTSAGSMSLVNVTDSWDTVVNNMNANETLTIDSQNELISSSRSRTYILNDFNLHWPRLLSGKNTFMCNRKINIEITFRAQRKVGFVL